MKLKLAQTWLVLVALGMFGLIAHGAWGASWIEIKPFFIGLLYSGFIVITGWAMVQADSALKGDQ